MLIKIITIKLILISIILSSTPDSSNTVSKKAAGIGYKANADGTIDNGIDSLLNTLESSKDYVLKLKSGDSVKISPPKNDKEKISNGKRSRASIMRVVMQNISDLRTAYNKRLRDQPELKGKVTIKYAINGSGEVIRAEVVYSSMADKVVEDIFVRKIMKWEFGKIEKLDDVTEVVYPFVFSQK